MPRKISTDDNGAVFFDMMTGLMFVFIIALVAYMLNFNDKHSSEMKLQSQVKDVNFLTTDIVRRVSKALRSENIPHTAHFKEGVIRLSDESLSFGSGLWSLNLQQAESFDSLSEVLSNVLVCYTQNIRNRNCRGDEFGALEAIVIEGHTDSSRYRGNNSNVVNDNRDLSYQRAKSVFDLLYQDKRLAGMKNSENKGLFQVAGYGASRPLSGKGSEYTVEQDRRIDIRFLMTKTWLSGG